MMEPAVLMEDLTQRYGPIKDVGLYKKCIVIPQREFKREWETPLRQSGHRIYYQDYNGELSVFISETSSVKASSAGENQAISFEAPAKPKETAPAPSKTAEKQQPTAAKPTPAVEPAHVEPKPAPAATRRGKPAQMLNEWKHDEDRKLLTLMETTPGKNITAKIKAIIPQFPGKTFNALYQRFWKLRHKSKKQHLKDKAEKTLKRACSAKMDVLEEKEQADEFSIPPAIHRAYVDALTGNEKDKLDFLRRAELLLKACA